MKSTPRALTTWLVLPLAAFSTACASNRQPVVVIKTPPASYLTCKPEPAAPEAATDKAVAQFITDALDAGQSCRDALARVRDWSKAVGK